jgi:hypothetical protein
LLAVLFLAVTVWNVKNAVAFSHDSAWCESRLLLQHIDPYHSGPAWLKIETEWGGDGLHYYSPASLVCLWPLAALDWTPAKMIWLFSKLCMTVYIFWMIRRRWLNRIPLDKFLVFSLLVYASRPWREDIGDGQQTLFALGLFLMGYELALKKHPLWAAIALQFSLLKWTFTLPGLLWMACLGLYAPVGLALTLHGILIVFSSTWLATTPWNLVTEYVHTLRNASALGDTDVNAVLSLYPRLWQSKALVLLFQAGTFVAMVRRVRRGDLDDLATFSIFVIWTLLVVYHGEYDMLSFIFPLALLFRDGIASKWHAALALALTGLCYAQIALYRLGWFSDYDRTIILQNFPTILLMFVCMLSMPQRRPAAPVRGPAA